MGNNTPGKEKALVPVATRFEEFKGQPLRIGIVAIDGEKVPVISLSDIASFLGHSKDGLWRLVNCHHRAQVDPPAAEQWTHLTGFYANKQNLYVDPPPAFPLIQPSKIYSTLCKSLA